MFGFFEAEENRTKDEEAVNQRFCALAGHYPDMNIIVGSSSIAKMFGSASRLNSSRLDLSRRIGGGDESSRRSTG